MLLTLAVHYIVLNSVPILYLILSQLWFNFVGFLLYVFLYQLAIQFNSCLRIVYIGENRNLLFIAKAGNLKLFNHKEARVNVATDVLYMVGNSSLIWRLDICRS